MPAITEQLEPERTILTLTFEKASSIAEYIGLKPARTRDDLNELIAEGTKKYGQPGA